MTMATGSIVKDLDVVEDVGTRHIPGFIDTFADSLFLQAAEKGFRHGVVPASAAPTHRRLELV